MLEGLELARAIYDRQRDSELGRRRKQGVRIPTFDELPQDVRRRLIATAKKCSQQYSRSAAREVPLIP